MPAHVRVKRIEGDLCRVSVYNKDNDRLSSQVMRVDETEYSASSMRIGDSTVYISWE